MSAIAKRVQPVEPDLELLRRWRAGDEAAGNQLILRYTPQLTRFFMGRASDHTQDLVQATLLALLRSSEGGTVVHSFRGYLFAIARSQLLMWARRADVEHRAEPFVQAGLPSDPRTNTSPSAGVRRSEVRSAIHAAVHALPLEFQIVVKLYYWHDLSIAEIAEATGVSEGTVKSRLSRARGRLSNVLSSAAEQASRDAGG